MNLVRVLKNARNAVVDRAFRLSKAAGRDAFVAELDRYRGGQLCFAIAFNTPWVIALLIDSWQRNVLDTGLAIVDNSSRPEARKAIEALCRARNVPYLGLPRNIEWNPNRSHGLALNWTFYNIVKAVRPAVFGFIDHDCFPLKPIRIAERMGAATVYGMRRDSERATDAWYVWPGYCFMRLDRVEGLPLDFKHRTELGLDTGGGNWPVLYRKLGPAEVVTFFNASWSFDADGETFGMSQLDGIFVHIGGASYSASVTGDDYRRIVDRHLRRLLDDGSPETVSG